jgi:hypothetical protein
MKKLLMVVATSLAVLGLSACIRVTGAPSAGQTGSNRPAETSAIPSEQPSAVESEPDVAEPEPTEAPVASDEPLVFGKSMTYADGLSFSIGKPKTFHPSEYALSSAAKAYVKFTVTLVNGTGKTFDPSMFNATAQSANVEADQVFDSAKGLGGGPHTKLLKGREAKFVIGFGVADPKDIVLEVRPSFEHESSLFTN